MGYDARQYIYDQMDLLAEFVGNAKTRWEI